MIKLNLPSVLAFERSIQPSIGLFWSHTDSGKSPVIVTKEKIRGTIGNKLDDTTAKKIGNANLQTIEVARLGIGCDTLIVDFNCLFMANSLTPVLCNDNYFAEILAKFTQQFKQAGGYVKLAEKYVTNIKNGTWLWRNRRIGNFEVELVDERNYEDVVTKVASALAGESMIYKLDVSARVKIGADQEVYPSQEFGEEGKKNKIDNLKDSAEKDATTNSDKDESRGVEIPHGKKTSRVLAKLSNNQAYFHSQKIGNAIRTIDEWYSDHAAGRQIAVEPFGVNQAIQRALRQPKNKNDLYSYLQNLEFYIDELAKGIVSNESLFIAACLIRGGVFGGKQS